jgi:hypothetical protein
VCEEYRPIQVITPEMIEAGVAFVCGYFPAEWGGKQGITDREARSLTEGVIKAICLARPETKGSS